jgi:hypothetical protein
MDKDIEMLEKLLRSPRINRVQILTWRDYDLAYTDVYCSGHNIETTITFDNVYRVHPP